MVGGPLHLTRRFVRSLRVRAPGTEEEQWLLELLSVEEAALYRAQPAVDRRHSLDCARALRECDPIEVVASALHDVGKAEAGLGTPGRVIATIVGSLVGRRRTALWRARGDRRGRIGRYCHHDERGAELLSEAGSEPLVIAWAREHHEGPANRSIDRDAGARLDSADC